MAYLGSTSTSPEFGLALTSQPIAGVRTWVYKTTDTHANISSAYYFTDGAALGAKIGDVVYVTITDSLTSTASTGKNYVHTVIAEATTTFELSTGTLQSS